MRHGESRRAILAAARAEFGEHGYAGARINRIAARSGLNKQLIYYYFQSKSGLHAAATAAGPPAVPEATTGTPAPDLVRGALSRLVVALDDRPDLVALLVDPQATAHAAPHAREWVAHAVRDVAAAVSRGQGLGYFRDDVDPVRIARQALAACLGFLAARRHLDGDADSWVRDLADTLLRATAW
jgi:TetR/AcrR family transcriptional regulator